MQDKWNEFLLFSLTIKRIRQYHNSECQRESHLVVNERAFYCRHKKHDKWSNYSYFQLGESSPLVNKWRWCSIHTEADTYLQTCHHMWFRPHTMHRVILFGFWSWIKFHFTLFDLKRRITQCKWARIRLGKYYVSNGKQYFQHYFLFLFPFVAKV